MVKVDHGSSAKNFDAFLESVKSIDLEVYTATRKRSVLGNLKQLKKKLDAYTILADALKTAWQNQPGFDGTEARVPAID